MTVEPGQALVQDPAESREAPESGPGYGRHVASGTLTLLVGQVVALTAGLLTTIVLTRQMGPGLYGLYSVALGIAIWVEIGSTSMFSQTTLKFVAEATDWRAGASTLAQAQLVTSLVAAILLAAAAPVLASWLGSPELTPYLRFLALGVPLFALAKVHRATLISRNGIGRGALLPIVHRIGQLVLVVLFVGMGWSLAGAILASLGASVLRLIVARLFVQPSLFRRPAFPLSRLLGYALPLFLFTFGMYFFDRLDLMVVKALGGPPEVAGHYGAAQNLTTMPVGMFAASFSTLLLATLPRLWKRGQQHDARNLIHQSVRLVWCFLPLAALVAASAPDIVDLILGGSFSPSAPLVEWLVFAALAFLMISTTTTVLTSAGRPGLTVSLTAPAALLAFGGCLLFVPRYGAIGAAVVTTVLAWSSAVLTLLAVNRLCGVRPSASTILRTGLVAVIVYALSHLWQSSGVGVVVEMVVMTGVVIGGLFLLGELGAQDWAFVQSLLARQRSGS